MTGLAICPERQDVILRKRLVNFQMAGGADQLIERAAKTIFMTVFTFKRSTVHSQTVCF